MLATVAPYLVAAGMILFSAVSALTLISTVESLDPLEVSPTPERRGRDAAIPLKLSA